MLLDFLLLFVVILSFLNDKLETRLDQCNKKKCLLYLKQLTPNLVYGIICIIVPTNYILLNVLTK